MEITTERSRDGGRIRLLLFIAASLCGMGFGTIAGNAAPPSIPRPNGVDRYERISPVFQSKQIPKERGDALLALLDGGRAVEPWMKGGYPPGVVCVLPVPARLWLSIALTNGTTYRIGLSQNGDLLELPEGYWVVIDAYSKQVKAWMAETEANLRKEITSAPKPCVYQVGTVDEGGTLSGISRLFYGDASKWRRIYDANRSILRNPDTIYGNEKLTIPKLN
jgi:hypothetical protein